ncbi:MAG: acyl-protein synthetase [Deltaproteobacteria bacterium]|nr:acyl-protein synthetase [Deltaproteobacteria bacterium]
MTKYSELLAPFMDAKPLGLDRAHKHRLLLDALAVLEAHHRASCAPYARMQSALFSESKVRAIEDVPFLPVRLLKELDLRSVEESEVVRVLHSSGTTGQRPSRVFLDRETADTQRRALMQSFEPYLPDQRLPMLIIDAQATIRREAMTARAAGIVGMMSFGRQHRFALRDDMSIDRETIVEFAANPGAAKLVFGFTFLVWQYLVQAFAAGELDLSGTILIHSGGWKKLEELAVDDSVFRKTLSAHLGIGQVHNFYGMVEQVGSVFVQCSAGRLHAPNFSEVIARRPGDWSPCEPGESGLLQVISVVPWSYPGHSLLTEDLGAITGQDDCPCGQLGTTFEVHGRVPRAELRGCSDTFQEVLRA